MNRIAERTGLLAIGVMASAVMAGLVMAGEGGHEHREGKRGAGMGMHGMQNPQRMVQHLSRWLDLDEAQTAELGNVVLATKPQMTELRERVRANHEAIMSLDVNASDYDARVQSLALEKGQLATEMTLLVAQVRVDINSKLTPAQQQTLAEGMNRKRQRWQERQREYADDGQR